MPFTLAMSGTATDGTDYATAPVTVNIAPGTSQTDVTLAVTEDALLEADETAIATFSESHAKISGFAGGVDNASATITDDDVAVATISKQSDDVGTAPCRQIVRVALDKV